jgi:hypothetical protein
VSPSVIENNFVALCNITLIRGIGETRENILEHNVSIYTLIRGIGAATGNILEYNCIHKTKQVLSCGIVHLGVNKQLVQTILPESDKQ